MLIVIIFMHFKTYLFLRTDSATSFTSVWQLFSDQYGVVIPAKKGLVQ